MKTRRIVNNFHKCIFHVNKKPFEIQEISKGELNKPKGDYIKEVVNKIKRKNNVSIKKEDKDEYGYDKYIDKIIKQGGL